MLDCRSEVAGIGAYKSVAQRSEEHRTEFGSIRILTAEGLIATKEALGRPKDIHTALQLKAILEARQQ